MKNDKKILQALKGTIYERQPWLVDDMKSLNAARAAMLSRCITDIADACYKDGKYGVEIALRNVLDEWGLPFNESPTHAQ
jgi:hypothetical protein